MEGRSGGCWAPPRRAGGARGPGRAPTGRGPCGVPRRVAWVRSRPGRAAWGRSRLRGLGRAPGVGGGSVSSPGCGTVRARGIGEFGESGCGSIVAACCFRSPSPSGRPRRPVGPRGHRRRVGLTGRSREILVAGVRAAAQLAAVSLLIGWVVRSVAPLLGFVALMFAVAVWTAGRRIAANRTWRWAAVPIGAGGAARRRGAAAHGARAGPGRGAHPGGGHPHRRGAHRDRTQRAACAGRTRRPARGGGGGHGPTRTPGWRSSGRRRRTRCRPGSIRPGPSDSSRCRGRSWACCWAAPHPWRRAPCSCSSWWALVALMAVQVVAVAMVLELVARGLLYRD